MKVGDYVRTNKGTFDRFITSHTQDNLTWYTFEDRGNITNPENYIIKSSPNIIDLIDVGDYVNGSKVIKIEEYNDEKYIYVEEMEFCNACNEDENIYYKEDTINSILTREQMKSLKYKVKE